jgi:hypothetical protein
LGLGILIAFITVYLNYFKKILKSQNQFFQDQVKKRNGNLNKGVPFGFQFLYQDIPIKVYVLSGSFHLVAQYALRENPSVLILKQYPYPLLRFLNYSPGKKRVLFNSPFDKGYSIQGKDEAWIFNVFSEKIQENMLKSNIGRLSIKRKILRVQFGILRLKDIEKIDHSIDVCLEVLDRILESDNKSNKRGYKPLFTD